MKIFVTGGAGFIGSNFVLKYVQAGHDILNFDKLTYAGNLENLSSIEENPNYHFIQGDICDLATLRNALFDYAPDAIVHFAAESHVDRSIDEPSAFILTNVLGTTNLLQIANEYAESNSDFRFLHVSTDEVYGSLGSEGYFVETTPYDPSSPYSASKAASDHFVRAWHRTFGLPALITNCSNNFGPFQFPEKLIPLMIINSLKGKDLPIYGDGKNVRDWLYVEDHCEAIFTVLNKGIPGETYNIGGNEERTNIEIVHTICDVLQEIKPKETGSYRDQITFVTDRPGHDLRYAIDANKIRTTLNWQANLDFKTGIRKTVEWYVSNAEWWENIYAKRYQTSRLGLKK